MIVRCSKWGEQQCDRVVMFLGSHYLLLTMKQTVLSIRKNSKVIRRCYSYVRYWGVQPCFGQIEDIAFPNVPLESYPGSEIIHLVLKRLDVGEQDTGQRWTMCSSPQSITNPRFPLCFLLCHISPAYYSHPSHKVSLVVTLGRWIKCHRIGEYSGFWWLKVLR